MSYKVLSLIQTIFITLASISVFDFGFSLAQGNAGEGTDGIFFNNIMFETGGLIADILQDFTLWGEIQFWGYCFFIVAICQLIKSFKVKIDS